MELPSGTVTFLFTDVEGSTRLLEELGGGYADALAEHRRVVREAVAAHGGIEVDTQGDAFFVAFARASDAVAAAAEAQSALELPVRMGLHTGEPTLTDEGYVGIDVHRAARIAAAGHGGQVLLSRATRDLVDGVSVRDLGDHRLKDLSAPERLYQLGETEFPRLKTLLQTNLPVQATPLVGRDRELAEVVALLRDGARLVTLTGPGGSGKTRLALHAAAEVASDFRDGVWFVSLASVAEPSVVERTVEEVAGAEFRSKELLLVLDNLEHLLPDVAAFVLALPVRVLATSRERLALRAEQEYDVPPLDDADAVTLFATCARRLVPSFEADADVGEIVRRVDRLPLAIELAAARVKVLSPALMRDRLGRALNLLTAGARDAPARQETLRATIEWSYDLLDDEERQVLRALSVFLGSFTVAAAEAVAETSVDTVAALVDRSLVRRTAEARLFLLETIREFALEELAAAEELDAARARHAAYYARWMPDAWTHADLSHAAFRDLRYELDNIRAAVAWTLEHDGPLDLVAQAAAMWELRGQDAEAAAWLDRALALERRPTRTRLDLLGRAAHFARGLGRDDDRRFAAEAVEIARALPDEPERLAGALNLAAVTFANAGDHGSAAALWEESLSIRPRQRRTLNNYANMLIVVGDDERAEELLVQVVRDDAVDRARALATHSLGDLALLRGDAATAMSWYREGLLAADALGFAQSVVACVAGIAAVAASVGDGEAAAQLWGVLERLEDESGPLAFADRGLYARLVGDVAGDPAFASARQLPADEARRLVDAYVHSN